LFVVAFADSSSPVGLLLCSFFFFFSSRRRHTRCYRDWSSDVCSSDLIALTLGIRAAAPVLTVAMLLGNLSRIWWNRADIDRSVTWRFLVGAVPATAVGAILYAGATSEHLRLIIGGFLVGAVPLRRLLQSRYLSVRLVHFPVIGVVFGLLSAIVVSTGPVLAPFY